MLRKVICPSVCPSVTLSYRDHLGWNSSKIIPGLVICGVRSLKPQTSNENGNTPKFWPKMTQLLLIWASQTFDGKLWPNGQRYLAAIAMVTMESL